MASVYNPKVIINGLVLSLDAANKKSYSQNHHPNPTDIFSWYSSNSGTSNASTISRATISSPVGNTPLQMVTTGNDPHIGTYNATKWNLASAVSGQTWTVSVWARASAATTGQIFIFEANSSGVYVAAPALTINITTEWQRFSYTYTFVNATTTNIQTRLDGADVFGSSVTIWWDGLQVERSSSVTDFTSSYTGDTILNLLGSGNNGTLVNGPSYNGSNRGSIVFDGTNDYIDLGTFFNYTNFTISLWVYPGSTQVQYADIFDNNHTGARNFVCQQDNLNTNQYQFSCINATNASSTSVFTLTANTWHYLTFTWNNSVASAYINGVFQSSGAAANPINYSAQNLRLGGWYAGGRNWNGRMANFVVHNRVLTASEIQQNFNALRGRFGI